MNNKAENPHISVLLDEALELLDVCQGGRFVDATLGLGGHSAAILSAAQDVEVIGFDQDPVAIELAGENLKQFGDKVRLIQSNFSDLREVLEDIGVDGVDGVIADLGVSSMQLDSEERGFSFRFDAPLDMRMNPDSETETAAELLARLNETEIADIIYQLGEERFSRRIAWRITEAKKSGEPIETTFQLANIVRRSVPRKKNERVNPATKTFQALRIAVNGELEILEQFLRDAVEILKPGGRIAVITFHSLEDRIVKQTFLKLSGRCYCPRNFPQCVCGSSKTIEILTKKPLVASETEQQLNPRSRSAKLRAIRKLDSN